MTNPMICPMSFNGRLVYHASEDEHEFSLHKPMECTPDCAWAMVDDDDNEYGCCVPSALGNDWRFVNTRPLKDDDELQTTPNYSKEDDAE